MDSVNANMRVVKQEVNTQQQEILNLRDKLVGMEDRLRKCYIRLLPIQAYLSQRRAKMPLSFSKSIYRGGSLPSEMVKT